MMPAVNKVEELDLYMDANTWLSFYHYTKDDLEELKKLTTLVELQQIRLHLPSQTYDEFRRNRDVKFAETLKTFKDEKFAEAFPQLCGEYQEETKLLKKLLQDYKSAKKALIEKMIADFETEKFKADDIIRSLYGLSKFTLVSRDVLKDAHSRSLRGNPPGKKGSLGDAINWECLLLSVEGYKDLYFISDDKDYRSAVGENVFSRFLMDEWEQAKHGRIIYFRKLSDFFKSKFPNIKLADEGRKDLYIEALKTSRAFAITRRLLRRMAEITDYTDNQINSFFLAVISNDQVYSIIDDKDIQMFVRKIMKGRVNCLENDLKSHYEALLGEPEGELLICDDI